MTVGTEGKAAAGTAAPGHAATVVVNDFLLFNGDYSRAGVDLVLSKDGQQHVVTDYFKGTSRAALSSTDGATLTPDIVKALVGEVQVAQLGGAAVAAQVIGTVSKLTGSATAIRNGVSVMLNVGDRVQKGDVVQAGADSTLGLTFIDGTVFGLSANARMVLNEMVYDPAGSSNSSLLSLVQGTITFVAGETAKHGDMRVATPVATMGIRGTAVLVEIGFEVPGQGGAPPVKFQVLVEPGGQVGSYVLYSRTDPTVIIATVDTAGQVTSVTGAGDASTTQAPPLSPEALAIIGPIFQLYFPNANPNPRSTSPSGGSPPQDPNSGTSPDPLHFNPFKDLPPEVPRTVPINLPDAPQGTPPIEVTLIRLNTSPTIDTARFAIAEGGTTVLSAANFGVSDPDSSAFTFIVSNVTHGVFQTSADGVHWSNASSFTSADLNAGHVRFVHDGGELAPSFTIQADDGAANNHLSNVAHGEVAFSNVNNAPVLTHAAFSIAEGGTTVLTSASIGVNDPDSSSFTFTVSGVTHGVFQTSADGVHWSNASSFTSADLNAGHVRFVHDGGEAAPSFAVQADDGAAINHLSGVLQGSVAFTNVNDAPQISAATLTASFSVPLGGSAGGGLSAGAAAIAALPGLISSIGSATGYGTPALAAGDDNSSGPIDITSVFGAAGINFFGTNYTSLYINNNGNLSFNAPNGTYTPSAIDAGIGNPIIAAFWADVDTRGTGHVYYTLDPIDGVMTITWDHVGYYNSHTDHVNSFQIVLLNEGGGNFDIQYRYADIQWTTGDASGGHSGIGGTPARAGYSAGDGVHYYELPQSGNQNALLHLQDTTGPSGVAFQVHDGEIGPPVLTATGNIDFTDADLGDSHTASATASGNTIGTLTLTRLHDTTGTGVDGRFGWTYDADSAAVRAALRDAPDHTLTETFVVTIDDGHGGTVARTVTVTLNGTEDDVAVNHAPDASPVTLEAVAEDHSLSITQADLLAQAHDVDGDALVATGLQIASGGGTLTDNHDGTWTYQPGHNASGTVSFFYQVSDGIVATDTTATLDVTPVADPPVLAAAQVHSVADSFSGESLDLTKWHVYLPEVASADIRDASVTLSDGAVLLHDRGYLQTVAGFAPSAANPLTVSGSFVLSDGYAHFLVTDRTDGATNPTYGNPSTGVTFVADAPHNVLQIVVNGNLIAQSNALIYAGLQYSFVMTDDGSHQTFSVTAADTDQPYSVEADIADAAAGNLVTFTSREGNDGQHTVTLDNVSVSNAYQSLEDTPIALAGFTGLTDTDGSETLALEISGFPTGATFSAGHLVPDSGHWAISASEIAALGSAALTMTPPQDYNGPFTLHVVSTVTDTATLSSGAAHDTRTFSNDVAFDVMPVNGVHVTFDDPAFNVTGINDLPVGHDDNLIVSAGAFGGEHGNVLSIDDSLLLANDTSPDGGTLFIAGYDHQPAHGSVGSSHAGSTQYIIAADQAPSGGSDSFSYIASDGTAAAEAATVNITVVAAGGGPILLSGTSGNDILIGGDATSENFTFVPGMGHDTVVNFDNVHHAAHDTIELDGFASVPVGNGGQFTETEFNAWRASGDVVASGNDTLIHLGADTLLLKNVPVASLHASDFIVHAGLLA